MDRFYVTTPIYYVNAKPHLGHAYTTIVADTLARFHQLMGRETHFLTGTDEHGDKIVKAAAQSGREPKAYVDEISSLFRGLWPSLSIRNDQFIRTTDARHVKVVQEVLQAVYDKGDIYFGEYGGHYCFGCERFYTEKELVNGLCPDHQTAPEFISEKNYFFRMSNHQGWLIDHIKKNPDFIRPRQYRSEVLSLLEGGALDDLCISRPKSRLTWGIDLPFDSNYVCYVWFDALLNYVSALGYPNGEKFKKFWPAANHLVAKDILKPHAVFWPTILRAAGIAPFQHLNVHGYWLIRDAKMSKSLGNVVDPLSLVQKYGINAFRYFLLREMAYGSDASFSEEALVARLNADLANDLGNLFNRTLSMLCKYFEGRVPSPADDGPEDADIKKLGRDAMRRFQEHFEDVQFSRGLECLWELVRGLNKYIDITAPWALHKNGNVKRLGTVMYVLLENMRKIAAHLWPVMPDAAEVMLAQLGRPFEPEKVSLSKELDAWGLMESGCSLAETSNLFPRVELPEVAPSQGQAPKAKKGEKAMVSEAPAIEFEDFQKLDLRVGLVLSAERHPDADKLLVLQVDLGEGKPRQIVSGIAGSYRPEDLPGRRVVVVANLKPRKIRKMASQGMILTAPKGEGLEILSSDEPVEPGAKIS